MSILSQFNKLVNFRHVVDSFLYSILLTWVTSGVKIINPTTTGWLSDGDGTSEIGWEFFRRTPLIQFPLGMNPDYGLEISSSVALDGQIPLFSLFLHPLSFLLPERFQYFGVFLVITFALNFYFARKIFMQLQLNNVQSIISSVILASGPIILSRFIDHTHYSLTSGWIIFYAILLILKRDLRFSKWIYIFLLSVLIHAYYFPFLIVIYLCETFVGATNMKFKIKNLITLSYILLSSVFVMYISGYFYGRASSKDVGYGFFRSTLSSLIDPSGWSMLLPDLAEAEGSYEGFAYVGIPTLFIIMVSVLLVKKPRNDREQQSFRSLWVASILLFVYSLSNNISYSNKEILSFQSIEIFSFITSTFRSSGRFSWLIVIIIVIYSIYILSQKIQGKYLTLVLLMSLVLGTIDYYPKLVSERNSKFNLMHNPILTNNAWKSISECYSKIRMYPPTPGVTNYYDFVSIALSQNMAINTGRFGRVNQSAVLSSYDLMHKEFKAGEYRNDSFYVFTNADFVSPEFVEYQKNLAFHTLDDDSASGSMDGYSFIAPNLKNCNKGDDIKYVAKSFGAPENQKYNGEKLFFGKGKDSSKYILAGFSALEEWGVWSVTKSTEIFLNSSDSKKFSTINLIARDLTTPANKIEVSINNTKIGSCAFSTEFSTCSIKFEPNILNSNVIHLGFSSSLLRSAKDVGLSENSQPNGFGMQSLYLE
jgi:hypothetical protein